MTTLPNITQFTDCTNITYIFPSTFMLISHNFIPTLHNPAMSITISPTGDSSSPLSSSSQLILSKTSSKLSNTEYSTLTTVNHSPTYQSPLPLTIYNQDHEIIPPSNYHTISDHCNISIQLNEVLFHHNTSSTLLYLTAIYIH
jgi:hypothetical protein